LKADKDILNTAMATKAYKEMCMKEVNENDKRMLRLNANNNDYNRRNNYKNIEAL